MDVDPKSLEQLIDDGRIDEVFELVSVDEAARAWCSYQLREDPEGPDWWAVELLFCLGHTNDPRERQMLALVIAQAPNEDVLGVAGAGPLEDFLRTCGEYSPGHTIVGHPPTISDHTYDYEERLRWVEEQAAASEKFRKALGNVWIRRHLPDQTVARLERATGTTLR